MEALVGPVPQQEGLLRVCHVVLDVAHLMVRRQEVIHGHFGAHLDPASQGKAFVVRNMVAGPLLQGKAASRASEHPTPRAILACHEVILQG